MSVAAVFDLRPSGLESSRGSLGVQQAHRFWVNACSVCFCSNSPQFLLLVLTYSQTAFSEF